MLKKVISWMKIHYYSFALIYMLFYIFMFFLLERITVPKYIIHSFLDDMIPFCEYFAIPYYMWLLIFPGSLIFYLFWDKEDFIKLCLVMFSGCTICFIAYIIFPSGLDLRPEITDNNILSRLMGLIWSLDTPTNVCPSLHVSTSCSIALTTLHSQKMKNYRLLKYSICFLMMLICMSTVFVKQHSVIDVFWGFIVSGTFYMIVYHKEKKKVEEYLKV